MKQRWLILAWFLPLVLFAQAPAVRKRPAPAGLKILATNLDAPTALNPGLRPVTVTVQNLTQKTVVAHAFRIYEYDKDGREINPHGAGVGVDYADPDSTHANQFIPPGAIRSIPVYSANLAAVTVKVTLTGLVYEDRSAEGDASGMFFTARKTHAQEALGAAVQQPPGEKRSALEKRAAWYEANSVEVEQ